MSKKKLDTFIAQTSMVFKSYDHQVQTSKVKSNLWHFSSAYQQKKYNIYCTLNLTKVQSLIKIALRKSGTESRLVVVCESYAPNDKAASNEAGYTLIDFKTLQKYGNDILEARAKDAMQAS